MENGLKGASVGAGVPDRRSNISESYGKPRICGEFVSEFGIHRV